MFLPTNNPSKEPNHYCPTLKLFIKSNQITIISEFILVYFLRLGKPGFNSRSRHTKVFKNST